jgi:hypothetical protein
MFPWEHLNKTLRSSFPFPVISNMLKWKGQWVAVLGSWLFLRLFPFWSFSKQLNVYILMQSWWTISNCLCYFQGSTRCWDCSTTIGNLPDIDYQLMYVYQTCLFMKYLSMLSTESICPGLSSKVLYIHYWDFWTFVCQYDIFSFCLDNGV